jgi:hypothetical protein
MGETIMFLDISIYSQNNGKKNTSQNGWVQLVENDILVKLDKGAKNPKVGVFFY